MVTEDDPRPILDLLWNGIDPPRRGPRHRLTVRGVVDAATAVAEVEGLAALSMRRVAAALGVGAATLYTYIPDKAALLALMVDTVIAEAPLPHTLPGTWRDKVAAWARADLEGYRAHPWLVDLMGAERPVGPGALAWTDSALRVFGGTGLADREALAVIGAVDGYVRGHAARAVDADRTARRVAPDGRAWSDAQLEYLADRVPSGRFPAVERLTEPGPGTEEVFEEGLSWLLDGVERRIADGRSADR
ncbi:TetR/AcrR family transcriptional regulator C-terminal domain-containing protein [Nocardiopsis sp. MT53]|uniref:TetR/AcrR family transcriptional regulator C-terminal domain-containing protein n=1 Tax=Nocardiopsis changdeensis TaxID=2831969 RepID=A0ABX8BH33_9ACTN|nr:TetR/AcrR family transcriptional regulator C-terminal domain-containing protein [Nocardiopsis changdeensis]QYX36185.1 TetR/AcrR family transcriptional regulator C-terminal domain-containing protein [Nocardiopsis sp. MT53]